MFEVVLSLLALEFAYDARFAARKRTFAVRRGHITSFADESAPRGDIANDIHFNFLEH